MDESVRRAAVYEALVALPEHLVGEIARGTLVTRSHGRPLHAFARTALSGMLHPRLGVGSDGADGWMLLFLPELRIGEDILVPDVAAWRRERTRDLPIAEAFDIAPNWVADVLPAETDAKYLADKMARYAESGVDHVWRVDPSARTLEIFRREGDGYLRVAGHRDDAVVHAEPFGAIELRLERLWGLPHDDKR